MNQSLNQPPTPQTQRTLFEPDRDELVAMPVGTGSTARQAAERIEPVKTAMQKRVLAFLRERGSRGATDSEMQEALDMGGNTQRPRRIELVAAGHVYNSGRTRKTTSGRAAVVWKATDTT